MSRDDEFHDYRRGFVDGAGFRGHDPGDADAAAYGAGWHDGRTAFRKAMRARRAVLQMPPETVIIIVNGRPIAVAEGRTTYEELLSLAGMSGSPSMTVKRPSGEGVALSPGGRASVQGGETVNIAHTGNS